MDSDFCNEIDEDYVQTVYNVVINSVVTAKNEKNRVFTTLDMFPTTLASLGVEIEGERLGLGTNLFSERLTLSEELGYEYFNNGLQKKSKFFDKLSESIIPLWVKDENGWKFYVEDENRFAVDEWISYNPHYVGQEDVRWFYIGEDGYALIGWHEINGEWCYFDETHGLVKKTEEEMMEE